MYYVPHKEHLICSYVQVAINVTSTQIFYPLQPYLKETLQSMLTG